MKKEIKEKSAPTSHQINDMQKKNNLPRIHLPWSQTDVEMNLYLVKVHNFPLGFTLLTGLLFHVIQASLFSAHCS